jgi:hypothetical protein
VGGRQRLLKNRRDGASESRRHGLARKTDRRRGVEGGLAPTADVAAGLRLVVADGRGDLRDEVRGSGALDPALPGGQPAVRPGGGYTSGRGQRSTLEYVRFGRGQPGLRRQPIAPPTWGIAAAPTQIVRPRRYSCSRLMSPNETQPTDAVDTAELELPAPAEQPAAEVQPGRPSWEPEDGDFS